MKKLIPILMLFVVTSASAQQKEVDLKLPDYKQKSKDQLGFSIAASVGTFVWVYSVRNLPTEHSIPPLVVGSTISVGALVSSIRNKKKYTN